MDEKALKALRIKLLGDYLLSKDLDWPLDVLATLSTKEMGRPKTGWQFPMMKGVKFYHAFIDRRDRGTAGPIDTWEFVSNGSRVEIFGTDDPWTFGFVVFSDRKMIALAGLAAVDVISPELSEGQRNEWVSAMLGELASRVQEFWLSGKDWEE